MPMKRNFFHFARMGAQQWNLVYFWIDFDCLSLIDDDIVESSPLHFCLRLFLLCLSVITTGQEAFIELRTLNNVCRQLSDNSKALKNILVLKTFVKR